MARKDEEPDSSRTGQVYPADPAWEKMDLPSLIEARYKQILCLGLDLGNDKAIVQLTTALKGAVDFLDWRNKFPGGGQPGSQPGSAFAKREGDDE